jgi:hypothetical protein
MSGIDIRARWPRASHFVAVALSLLLVVFVCGCAASRTGVVQEVEQRYVAVQPDPPSSSGLQLGRPKVVSGFVPTGYVIVRTTDGATIRCKSEFTELGVGARVELHETSPGEWAVTGPSN